MLKRTNKQIMDTVRMYILMKSPFKLIAQNETLRIESKIGSYCTKHPDFKMEELSFIKSVRHYIIKNELYKPFEGITLPKPVYNSFNKNLEGGMIIEDCVNIDIRSAYWVTAYKLGLLSEDIYTKGTTVRKLARLAAIGSLNKKEHVYEFDGKTQKAIPVKDREHTAVLWNVICGQVGDCLLDIARACGDDFIYFWVDGIYVKKSAAPLVKKMFKQYGYEFSINKIKNISITPTNLYVNLYKAVEDKNGVLKTSKPFPFKSHSDRLKPDPRWNKRFAKMMMNEEREK